MIDFHSHVLPELDDGAKCTEEAVLLLLSQKEQGIHTVIATPHYTGRTSVEEFLCRRKRSLVRLLNKLPESAPRIIPAAEVGLFYGLSGIDDLFSLCIDGTHVMLIEMPFFYWDEWVYEEISKLIERGVQPVLAHLDRYMHMRNEVKKLLLMDVSVQINAEAFCKFKKRFAARKILSFEKKVVLGSDCHDAAYRPCRFREACEVIQKKWGENTLEVILKNAEHMIK